MVAKPKLHIIAYAALGRGLSGGDNILIELSKRWADKLDIIIYGGYQIKDAACAKNLQGVIFNTCPSKTPFHYLERLFYSLRQAFQFNDSGTIYTASDFLHDLLCGWIIKLRNPKIKWISGYYLVAPPIFAPNSPYRGFSRIRGIGYWLMQRFTLKIVNKWADTVYVTSVPEMVHFPHKKTIIIRGGVNIPKELKPDIKKEFDAVFMGRFHYQKGVLELIDIWDKVCKIKPNKKLVMIGDGTLWNKCQIKTKKLGLEKNIIFVPFAGDNVKEFYFSRSKIILHPATFDSGGMSAAEGMAYGLPCVGFDLEVFKTYYPRGMIYAKNKNEFTKEIINLLTNKAQYNYMSKQARDFAVSDWDWDKRAESILNET